MSSSQAETNAAQATQRIRPSQQEAVNIEVVNIAVDSICWHTFALAPILMMKPTSYQSFPDSQALGEWLAEHHATTNELWVRIYKSASGKPSVTWADCVVEAIRFGWIDGQKKPLDDSSFLQRLSPRKPGSNWSSKNREYARKLIQEGRMTPAGLAHVEAAQKDGRWEKAYAGSADMEIPEDFLTALNKLPKAKQFFATLSRQNLFAIYYRLQTAKKPETRAKRMAQILSMLEKETKLH